MRFKPNTECLYCNEVYKIEDHTTCPNCAVNTDTKAITVIVLDKEEE
jgi:rRNA maturation endonuclease Nob1